MDTNRKTRETISAFADGELPESEHELALASLREPDGRQTWALYHRIGDLLRASPPAPAYAPELSPAFSDRLAARLAAEPLPPRRAPAPPAGAAGALSAISPTLAPLDGADGAQPAPGATACALTRIP